MEMRDQYFKEADRLRALSHSTVGIAVAAAAAGVTEQQAINKKGHGGSRHYGEFTASNVAQYLQSCANNPNKHTPELLLNLLSAYLAIQPDSGELKYKDYGSDEIKILNYPGSLT